MYFKKTWIYGNRIEVRKYHSWKAPGTEKGGKRSKREKPTPEEIEKANERAAMKRLERLLIGNFEFGDWHLTLTYRSEDRPDPEEAKKRLDKFIRKMRAEYKRLGKELKYIIVTEWQGKAIHHHMAINDIEGFHKLVAELWGWGGSHLTALYDNRDYAGLAEYFLKETKRTFKNEDNPYKQRYSASRNMKKPEVKTEQVKSNSWRKEPKETKAQLEQGYVLDKSSIYVGINKDGYPYQEYVLIMDERKGGVKDGRRVNQKVHRQKA